MKLLALDTSSVACSVALQLDHAFSERHEEEPREHTRLLMPMVRSLLADSGAELRDLDAVVLGNGPGSFIGMRIAASVAQGLAYGAGLKVVPVSSLAAVAAEVLARCDVHEVVVSQDAHMNEVYLGIFERGDDDLPAPRIAERLHGHGVISELEGGQPDRRIAAGFGWQRYPDLLAANERLMGALSNVQHPRARHLLPLGERGFRRGEGIDPKDLKPAYLRQKVAEKPPPAP